MKPDEKPVPTVEVPAWVVFVIGITILIFLVWVTR